MAFISLSIPELYKRTFGEEPPQGQYDPAEPKDYMQTERGLYGSRLWLPGSNGLYYYMPAVMTYLGKDSTKELVLPHPVLSWQGEWNIVKTALTQRSGTFKQVVGLDDYQITVRGLIVSDGDTFPESEIQGLKNLFAATGVKTLRCAFTDIALNGTDGRLNVFVESIRFPETKGVKNTRGYEMKLVSDAPFNLVEKV